MTNFRKVIEQAYTEILGRPADPGGLAHYQGLMEAGHTEWEVREWLVRSPEFAEKNPSDGPPPPPPPPGPPGAMAPLRVQGNQFTAGGRPIKLLGMILCCSSDTPGVPDEAVSRGWPSTVDDATLDFMASNKLNYVHVRTGPFRMGRPGTTDDGETADNVAYADAGDGRVDLLRWNPVFWQRLRRFVAAALVRGIYVEIDLVDVWVLHHELGPWSPDRNVQGFNNGSLETVQHAPQPVHEAWVRKVVQETREFPNVIYQDGNEAWKGAAQVWVHRLRDIVRAETSASPRLFGSNANIDADVDYWTFHKDEALDAREKPVMVNEYPSQPPHVILAQITVAREKGTAFHYWRGGNTWSETQDVVRRMKGVIEGQDAFPPTCPRLVKWQPKVHIVMDSRRRLLEDGVPVEGGFVFLDSTPRFGAGNGAPCNAEHNVVCGGRPCEDPRGGIWIQTQGNAQVRVENPGDSGHGYQCLVGPLGPPGSTYTLRIEALPDAKDALGKPLDVAPNHAREVTFTVGQRTRAAAEASAVAFLVGEEDTFRPVPASILAWIAEGQEG